MSVGQEVSVEPTRLAENCRGCTDDDILGVLHEAEPIAEGVLLTQVEEDGCPCAGSVGQDELAAKPLAVRVRVRLQDAHLDDLPQHGGRLMGELLREERSIISRSLNLLHLLILRWNRLRLLHMVRKHWPLLLLGLFGGALF